MVSANASSTKHEDDLVRNWRLHSMTHLSNSFEKFWPAGTSPNELYAQGWKSCAVGLVEQQQLLPTRASS